jgi:hypothetical protein
MLLGLIVLWLFAYGAELVYIDNNFGFGLEWAYLMALVAGAILGLFGFYSGKRRGWSRKAIIWFTVGCILVGALLMYYYEFAFLTA